MNKPIRAKSNPSFFHVYTFNSQGGPPAVTKNEKSSSLQDCIVGRRREHRSIPLVILIISYILYIYFLKWLRNYLRKTPCVPFFGAEY